MDQESGDTIRVSLISWPTAFLGFEPIKLAVAEFTGPNRFPRQTGFFIPPRPVPPPGRGIAPGLTPSGRHSDPRGAKNPLIQTLEYDSIMA